MSKISLIIPTYNHLEDYLKPCIKSIKKYTDFTNFSSFKESVSGYSFNKKDSYSVEIKEYRVPEIELIVISNGCTDNTDKWLEENGFKWLGYGTLSETQFLTIPNKEPLGFSKSINLGIQSARGDYIILLNNDTILLPQKKNEWIDILLNPFLKDNKVGISGPLMSYSPSVQRNFLVFFCVAIKREVIDEVGLLDEDFNIGGGEDTNYCIRTEEKGYKLIQVPNKINYNEDKTLMIGEFPIYHKGEGTVNDKNCVSNWKEIFEVNDKLLSKKHKPKRLHLGCGDMLIPDFINIDLYTEKVDVKSDVKILPFKTNSIDEIYSSHVIEHFDFFEGQEVLKEWIRVLKTNSIMTIETPNLEETCKFFLLADEQEKINNFYYHIFGKPWESGGGHKFLYTKTQIKWTLENLKMKDITFSPGLRYIGKENICMKVVCRKGI